MGFELDFEENTRWSRIRELAEAIHAARFSIPVPHIWKPHYGSEDIDVFIILEQLVRASTLQGYLVEVTSRYILFKDLRSRVQSRTVCVVDLGGGVAGDCGSELRDPDVLLSVLSRLADGYFTLIVYILDSEYAEHLSRKVIERLSNILGRLAELGATLDPELLERIRELERALRVRIYVVRDADAVKRFTVPNPPIPGMCKVSLDGVSVRLGWYEAYPPGLITSPVFMPEATISYAGSPLGIGIEVKETVQGYVAVVKPMLNDLSKATAKDVYELTDLMKRWREIMINALKNAESKHMCRRETITVWLKILENIDDSFVELP